MENNMVENEWICVVKQFFKKELPKFRLKKSCSHGPFWNIEFINSDITVKVNGDIGFDIHICIYNSEYALWRYDRSVNDRMVTTEENILYQLNVLKNFIDSVIDAT